MHDDDTPGRHSRGHSTRLTIGLAFAALALVLFVVVGLLSGSQARRQMEADTGAALGQLAARMAMTLDMGMFERYREIQNLAAFESLQDDRLEATRWRELTARLQNTFSYYTWIGVADAKGTVIASTGGVLEGRDVSQRPWFARGRSEAFVGDVHEALLLAKALPPTASNEPLRLVDFSAPVRRGAEVLGVLGAHLSWAWAEERRAQLLTSLDAERHVEVLVLGRDGQQQLGPTQPAWPSLAATALEDLVRRGHAVQTWGDGQAYLTAAASTTGFQTYPGLGWVVVVRQPLATAMAAADRLQYRLWTFGLFGAAVFGLIAWWLAGRLTAPLRAVARQAQRLVGAADPTPTPAAPAHQSEVVQLASSLNSLVMQLQQRERELLRLNETLEARIGERTDSLQQANADLQSFSRSVSHDLKGPIGSMGMALQHVLDDSADRLGDRSQRMLAEAVKECDRLRVLIDELLTLAMVEQRELQRSRVSMQEMVRVVVAELRATAAARAEVVVDDLPEVEGDAVLLRQVWQNLLANAFKFSAKGNAPRIEVRAQRGEDELVFSVQDNGAGFDMSQADRLFGVFQRLHRASDFPGTGVGLSIVKRVVHRHGGRVWARAAPGQGAQFFFALPLATSLHQ
jgi:signal transduction histidine kinase